MLKIKSISKSYEDGDEVEVIKNLNLNVKEKDFIVLVGPSGCGKTTLLKCIAGLTNFKNGEIILNDKKVNNPNKYVGMVFQDFSLFPWLTVKENIEFGLKISNVSKKEREKIVEYYLKITELKEFENMYPKSLSGGMKQKVAIARTLANNPKVILMDEPFGSLDNITRSKMQEFLIKIWEKENKTIIFVTHDVEEAIFLGNEVYVLSKRPAKLIKEFKILFKRPRQHKLKSSKEFFDLKNRITKLLE